MFIGLRFVAVDSLRTRHSSWSIELQVGKPLDRHLDKKRNQIVACRFTNVWLISSCNAGPLFGLCPLSMVVHLCDFSALDILCQYRCRSVSPRTWQNGQTCAPDLISHGIITRAITSPDSTSTGFSVSLHLKNKIWCKPKTQSSYKTNVLLKLIYRR